MRENSGGAFQAWFGQATGAGNNCEQYFAGSVARLTGKTGTLGEFSFTLERPDRCDT